MVLSFDKINRIITVPVPTTEITVQTLVNEIRDWEDELVNIDVAKIADASGKEDLGGGLSVGITLKLLNWKLKFADRSGPDYIDCSVTGGNLVAVNANNQPMNPIQPAAYVTVIIMKAVSAALIADVAEWTQIEKNGIMSNVDTIQAKTNNLPADPAAQSLVTAVKTKTDQLPTDPASESAILSVDADLEKHDTDIKGVNWTDETLKKIKELIEAQGSVKSKITFPL